MDTVHFASCTRIADPGPWPLDHRVLPREEWEAGDYVVGRIPPFEGQVEGVELTRGREVPPVRDDLVVGIRDAWGVTPNRVAGSTTNTSAAVDLMRALTGLEGLNLMRRESHARFGEVLAEALAA
ncbi:MAG TPA: hypothetical protein VLA43_05530 [Longimicrobiales bacterium]|nr:hypothetical protein [Longimicrobiales bacterium]